MSDQLYLEMNDGRGIPQLGFGTWKIADGAAAEAVGTAIDVGYRLVDTAAIYENERGVGKGMEEGVFLTTKIWNDDQGFDSATTAFEASLDRLGRETVDLLLIHWPCPDKGRYLDTWKAMIELRDEGRAKSIGVSNFQPEQIDKLIEATGVTPALNQIELHPRFQQRELREVHDELGIVTQSWSPLGRGDLLRNEVVARIAEAVGCPTSAVLLRWHLQSGLATIPKASSREHMAANLQALDFELSETQMSAIDELDDPDGRMGPHPNDFC